MKVHYQIHRDFYRRALEHIADVWSGSKNGWSHYSATPHQRIMNRLDRMVVKGQAQLREVP